MSILKQALGLAFVLGWAGATLAADAPAPGQASGSLPPSTSPAQIIPPTGACCDSGYGNGCCGCLDRDNCGEDCVPGSGVIVGATWHILRPVINDNVAFRITTFSPTTEATVQQNFQYRFKSDPSIWLGYRSCDGLGFTVTWFHLDNSAETETTAETIGGNVEISPAFEAPGLGALAGIRPGTLIPFTFNNDIKMDIWDFDVTQRVEVCHFDLTFGGGIRYMWIAQDYNLSSILPVVAFVNRVPQMATLTDTVGARNSFNGGGPTLILNGLRRFGCSGFGLYANSRLGVLFGPKHETIFASSVIPGLASATTTTTSDNESTIGFGEIELGAQWSQNMGSVSPFVRIGFEGREYWGIGNASNTASGNNSTNVGAYGVALSAGVGW
jgi:hypothetical protein